VLFLIELEIMLNDLSKIRDKEKGLRNRHLIDQAISSLKEYEKAMSTGDATYVQKRRLE